MRQLFVTLVQAVSAHFRRQASVSALRLMNDHLLLDIGLRREQIDLLLLPDEPAPVQKAKPVGIAHRRPSLQGCG